jgi:phosphatidate cytidylyltransferase
MLILSPTMTELAIPLLRTFGGLLGAGLVGILIALAFLKDSVLKKQLILRWCSWAIICVLSLLALEGGKVLFSGFCALVAVACILEFCKITARSSADRVILFIAALTLPFLICFYPQLFGALALFAGLCLTIVSLSQGKTFEASCISLVALVYIPVLASHAVLIFGMNLIGPALLISVVASSALANIAAFIFGKLLGGAKLAPEISPNKTWWGVFGSFIGAYFGFGVLTHTTCLDLPLWQFLAIPPVVAIAGIIGDLFESGLKRSYNTKDAGTWLPGFGGALDRVDGLLFVVPCVYYLFSL